MTYKIASSRPHARPLVALVAMLSLAACGKGNPGLSPAFEPQVKTERMFHDIVFEGRSSFGPGDAAALESFLAANQVGYGDRLTLDDPLGEGAAQRRAAIAVIAGKFGLLLDATAAVPTSPPLAAGRVRLVVTRAVAQHPNCPDWHQPVDDAIQMYSHSNYGCASVGNLAAMVADPNDFENGKVYRGADATTVTKAIESWRKAPPTSEKGLAKSQVTSGAGSSSN